MVSGRESNGRKEGGKEKNTNMKQGVAKQNTILNMAIGGGMRMPQLDGDLRRIRSGGDKDVFVYIAMI